MAAEDRNSYTPGDLAQPADYLFGITPHDSNELAYLTRGIYVGSGGDVAIIDKHGNTVTFVGVPTGLILPVRANIVKSTGTTASSLVGLS